LKTCSFTMAVARASLAMGMLMLGLASNTDCTFVEDETSLLQLTPVVLERAASMTSDSKKIEDEPSTIVVSIPKWIDSGELNETSADDFLQEQQNDSTEESNDGASLIQEDSNLALGDQWAAMYHPSLCAPYHFSPVHVGDLIAGWWYRLPRWYEDFNCGNYAADRNRKYFQVVVDNSRFFRWCWQGNECSHRPHLPLGPHVWRFHAYTNWNLQEVHLSPDGDACDTASVDQEVCLAAVFKVMGRRSGNGALVVGNWHWVPVGCSVQLGSGQAHLNGDLGFNDGGYRRVCQGNHASSRPTRILKVDAGIFWESNGKYYHVPTCHMCFRNFCDSNYYHNVDRSYLNTLEQGPQFSCDVLRFGQR